MDEPAPETTEPARPPRRARVPAEVRYSLAELLSEIDAEKGSASFATETLDQSEIGKLFRAKKTARVKPKT